MHKHLTFCTMSLVLAAGACAGSQAEQVKDARMEQAAAHADNRENRVEQASSAREESLDKAYDRRGESIAAANPPAEGAAEELNEVAKDRALYQSQAETRVDKIGVRIDEAAKKINLLGNRAPIGLSTQLKTATTEYQMLRKDIGELERTPTTSWESMTSNLDKRLSALDSRVEDLQDQIEDV
jgi:hypothetical protein